MQTLNILKKYKLHFLISWLASIQLLLLAPLAVYAVTNKVDVHNCRPGETIEACVKRNPIIEQIEFVVNILSAGVAIVVVGTIIFGGIQYIVAGENPTAITAAKQRIVNGLIALVAFIFTFAFLQWIIPGGLFSQ